ncbi:MAG: nicotinate phosphoribosyltransferase [Chloroflexi bacterium]|nr:nicotinate phosphoribosyltransferase [Chloroflexota bacterium]MBK90810.1 nicotinate phosphoribosyltransferase [Chloroflexota bacterium]|tara:strand:- start:7898 stop:8899 length:1002 start_codon:yes stop_codon:yes gene_type:complete
MTNNPKQQVDRSIIVGETSEIYLHRTLNILRNEGLNPFVTYEIESTNSGIICGINQIIDLLDNVLPEADRELWALQEGNEVTENEVVLRIKARFASFGLYETSLLGTLTSCSSWATAAHNCVVAASGIPVVSFASRSVHPSVAGQVDYSAYVGGCSAVSSLIGGKLTQTTPSGTMPHSLVLIMGETVRAALAFDRHMEKNVPRVVLIDTFKDEAEEAIQVGKAMKETLRGIRIETPIERGGITPHLVDEINKKLEDEQITGCDIYVSGDMNPDDIKQFVENESSVAGFAIDNYIARGSKINFRADIKEIEGKAIARRGRMPGMNISSRLDRIF